MNSFDKHLYKSYLNLDTNFDTIDMNDVRKVRFH
jgi:hypothetical protein